MTNFINFKCKQSNRSDYYYPSHSIVKQTGPKHKIYVLKARAIHTLAPHYI